MQSFITMCAAQGEVTPVGSVLSVDNYRSSMTDSTSTLTESNQSDESFDKLQAKVPLYSSDTRLMEFADSDSTLNVSDNYNPSYITAGLKKIEHHQSDTRLLHASQIELKSTNYFTRPPLSCSSLEEEVEEEDYRVIPADGRKSRLYSSQVSSEMSSAENLRSPDGSYFSIESGDIRADSEDDEDEEGIYENVAAIRASMISNSSQLSLPRASVSRSYTVYQNYPNKAQERAQPTQHDTPRHSNISLIQYEAYMPRPEESNTRPTSLKQNGTANLTVNNNRHLISNGSSAYGSGSLAASDTDSDFDTYL